MLRVENLSVAYGDNKILNGVSFGLEERDWLMIIGPNGAGKTTITNAIAQGLNYTGNIYFENEDLKTMKPKERAKKLGVLMQSHFVSYGYSVRDVIALGSYSKSGGIFSKGPGLKKEDIREALKKTGMENFEYRSVQTLSGGELQRVFLSQLILQNPNLMILDEPTNHLDLTYQECIFGLVDNWRREKNRAVISVVHDLRLARMYGTKALLLKEGQVHKFGNIEEVMTRENLQKVYGVDVYAWMNKLSEKWTLD